MNYIYKIYYDNVLVAMQKKPKGVFYKLGNRVPSRMFGLRQEKETADYNSFERWLSGRVFPKERINGHILLRQLGMDKYDAMEIARKNKGMTHRDLFSISWEPYNE